MNENAVHYWWCEEHQTWTQYIPTSTNEFHRVNENRICYRDAEPMEKRVFKYHKSTGRGKWRFRVVIQTEIRNTPSSPWKVIYDDQRTNRRTSED